MAWTSRRLRNRFNCHNLFPEPDSDIPGLIGVIVDPTIAGIGDSELALRYAEPWDEDDNRE